MSTKFHRFIFGKHPYDGSYGMWLSLPGVDAATTVDPTKFLLCPTAKNEQLIHTGRVDVVAGGISSAVYYPYTFSTPPVVTLLGTSDGNQVTFPTDLVFGVNKYMQVQLHTDRMYVVNQLGRQAAFYYMIFAR